MTGLVTVRIRPAIPLDGLHVCTELGYLPEGAIEMKRLQAIFKESFQKQLTHHISVLSGLTALQESILGAGEAMIKAIEIGNKIMVCGNGGSAADAQHFSTELVARFEMERSAWPAIALTTDTSILTAIGNDYGFDSVFSRQVEAFARDGDILVCISTSGSSPNVLKAAEAAYSKNVMTIGLLGKDGGTICKAANLSVIIPDRVTARIQEAHSFILHYWCSMIEQQLTTSIKNTAYMEKAVDHNGNM